jgi:hypothetical protein
MGEWMPTLVEGLSATDQGCPRPNGVPYIGDKSVGAHLTLCVSGLRSKGRARGTYPDQVDWGGRRSSGSGT